MRASDALLIVGATARLTRVVVADSIGKWWIRAPADSAMERYEARHTHPVYDEGVDTSQSVESVLRSGNDEAIVGWEVDPQPWWWKYRVGLECPHCVGFWIGAGVVGSFYVAKQLGLLSLWRAGAGILSLNVVVAHGGSLIEYYGEKDGNGEED